MKHTAKLFMNGASQTVRLPREFRFEGDEIYIRRDKKTGDVILSKNPESWDNFLTKLEAVEVPQDFMAGRDAGLSQDRELFE